MASRRTRGRLSPSAYDERPSGRSTGSASSSDSENSALRSSHERARHDQEVLDEEEEEQKLLAGAAAGGRGQGILKSIGSRRSQRQGGNHGEDKKETLYDTEEGDPGSSTPSLASSEEDREKIGYTQSRTKKPSLFVRICRYTLINVLIAGLFVAIAFGAYEATKDDRQERAEHSFRSNGTHMFAPTTILISLDGFRADFLQRGLTPTLNAFIREGVSPKYMLPSFPSVTFPNHYTLVTGLYPESHGIVGNNFWDPALDEEFYYTDPLAMNPKWWHGEPLWVTAEAQGVRVATHMWPGSEAHIGDFEPAFVDKYNGSETLQAKVSTVLDYLDRPGPDPSNLEAVVDDQRPQLIAAYVPNVDADGHKYGPNSTEIKDTIQSVDSMMGSILDGLKDRNLTEIVNVVVVSDHGMATTSTNRTIQLEDLIDLDLISHIDGWPHYGLRPKDPSRLQELYKHLKAESEQRQGFDVYLKSNMPERYHFTNNPRIAPLWIFPRTGWAIVRKGEFDVSVAQSNGDIYHPRGIHGYDHEHPLMRAIFVARGPSFPHTPGSRVDVFQNTEVYNIICDSVGVEPKANNGTLRLPLKPTGVHGEDIFEGEEPVSDPPAGSAQPVPPQDPSHAEPPPPPPPPQTELEPPLSPEPPESPSPPRPVIEEESTEEESESWLDWMHSKIDSIKHWAHDTFGAKKEDLVVEEEEVPARPVAPPRPP